MISTVMAELQLEGLAAQGKPSQLMAKTNPEDRLAPHEPADRVDRVRTWLGIARAVRQEEPIWLKGEHIFGWSLRRHHRYFAPFSPQFAQDVLLDAEVVGNHVKARWLVFHSDHGNRFVRALADFPHVRSLGADFLRRVGTVHPRKGARLRDQFLRVTLDGRDHTAHHAMIPQMAHQSARIDIREHWHFELLQIFFRHLLRAPVRADARELAYDQPFNPRTRSLVIVLVGTVISDLWIRQNDDLSGVGGIGENFLVSGDGSIKNDFAVAFAFGAVAFASEDSTVFQRKDSLHSRSEQWIL